MVSEGGAAVVRSAETTVSGTVTLSTTPSELFTDPESDMITLSAESSNTAIADISTDTITDTTGLGVTGVAKGTATITLKGTTAGAGLGQETTTEFTVTVK